MVVWNIFPIFATELCTNANYLDIWTQYHLTICGAIVVIDFMGEREDFFDDAAAIFAMIEDKKINASSWIHQ